MSFKFSGTEPAKSSSFITPGIYRLKPTEVKLGNFKTGTSYMEITFENESGVNFSEKFSLTEKALSRLQYLHQAFFGKLCNKNFETAEEVVSYFDKYLTTKPIVKNIIVGGEIAPDGKVYASLPYTDFVNEDAELGEFTEGSAEWKKYVHKRNSGASEVEGKGNGLLSDDEDEQIGGKKAKSNGEVKSKEKAKELVEEDSDLPW